MPTSVPPRLSHSLAYDPVRRRVVLFGGMGNPGPLRSDTWEWDGRTWTEATTSVAPPACHGAMTFDAARMRAVLLTGYEAAGCVGLNLGMGWRQLV